VLLPEPGYGELDALGVPLVVDHHIDYASDAASLVRAAIHIENWDGLQETPDQKVPSDDVLGVNEVSGRSAVDQSLSPTSARWSQQTPSPTGCAGSFSLRQSQ
jgi:hypothetical protein